MADIALVVKIPEEMYKKLLNKGAIICLSGYEAIIANGIPLDKIRAKIEQTHETEDGFLMHEGTKKTVLSIIDRCKAESEDT